MAELSEPKLNSKTDPEHVDGSSIRLMTDRRMRARNCEVVQVGCQLSRGEQPSTRRMDRKTRQMPSRATMLIAAIR